MNPAFSSLHRRTSLFFQKYARLKGARFIMFLHIKRILVVDDEAELKHAIIRHLRRNGFNMDSAVGTEDAKRKSLHLIKSACLSIW